MIGLTEQQNRFLAVKTQLRDACASARHDAALFTVLTVLLTPLAVAIFLFILLFVLAFVDLPLIDDLGYQISFVTGANICLAFMAGSYFLRPKDQRLQCDSDGAWLLLAAGLFCIIFVLSYFTPLTTTHPTVFWLLYLFLAMIMLGCIGYAYEPRDDYYIGWTAGPLLIDDPFTLRDDIDRAHIGLGFAVSISSLILESYGAIFGSRWLWRGLQDAELTASATLLLGLAGRDASGVMARLRGMGKDSAADVVRALVKLELVVIDNGRPRLSKKGRELIGQ